MLKALTKKEFEEMYPDAMIYCLEMQDPVYLEGGVILINDEWNGEVYTVKDEDGNERIYKPVYEPIDRDEDGEATQWDLIGCDEWF